MKLSVLTKIGSFLLHLVSLATVVYLVLQVGNWYYAHRPVLGVDFYNTVTHTKYLHDNFEFLPRNFKYFWYGGVAGFQDVYFLLYNATALISNFLPLVDTVRVVMVGLLVLFVVFVYLAAYRLSENHPLSLLLSILVAYSANIYGALTWGGSLPYFSSQIFFPMVLWLMASYLATGNKKWYLMGAFASGLAVLAHLASAGAFIFPSIVILLLVGVRKVKVSLPDKFKEVGLVIIIAYLVGLRITRSMIKGTILTLLSGKIPYSFGDSIAARVRLGSGGISVTGNADLIGFERSHFQILFNETNHWLYLLLGLALTVLVIGLLLDKNKERIFSIFAWLILCGYSVIYVLANSYGFTFLFQGWYRAFWHFPVTLSLFIAAIFGYTKVSLSSRFKLSGIFMFITLGIVSVLGIFLINFYNEKGNLITILEAKASPSSAHPEALNLIRNQFELDKLKLSLVPPWLQANQKNYRLYTSDAQVNVWWNSVFDLPLVRGYLDPPIGSALTGNDFLLDQAVGGDGLVANFKYPVDTAKNMALYYIDWNSIAFAEGGHESKSPNKAPSSYLSDSIDTRSEITVPGAYILYETKSGKPEVWEDVPQKLIYYRFKSDLVSPIVSVSNSPSLLCLCNWSAYESLTKTLSMNNINSQYLVTAFYENSIESLDLNDISKFDVIVLSNYKYNSRGTAFGLLEQYVKKGGKVFIETGTEVSESEAQNLPGIFPFSSTLRKGLGKVWNLKSADDPVFQGVDLGAFSPPLYNEAEWKFSFPQSTALKSDSEVLLKNADKPLIIRRKLGNGVVVWSGMNLAYHIHANTNVSESVFLLNILNSLVRLERQPATLGTVEFKSSRNIIFTSQNSGHGVMLREEFYPGWKVKVNGREVKAYQSGPTYPGFIFVPIATVGPVKVDFSYYGEPSWYFIWGVSLMTAITIVDLTVFNGLIIGRILKKLLYLFKKGLFGWWEKEES
ncbi:hypothetical protein HY045_00270 [Candidatus Woesebacteria bacterium]|nr:hypothetical protein [Candidatus Woesebacteria bacterium]